LIDLTPFRYLLTHPFTPLSLKGVLEGLCPSLTHTPPSLIKGRGPGGFPEKSKIFLGAEGDRSPINLSLQVKINTVF
jgi:hypothetical protein